MLGMLINAQMPFGTMNTWSVWIDHIMKYKEQFAFKQAVMVKENGSLAATCNGFTLPAQDIARLKKTFDAKAKASKPPPESVSLGGSTFLVKSMDENQLICWNGRRYYIISKSKGLFIIVLCESRSKVDDGARWLKKIAARLLEKGF